MRLCLRDLRNPDWALAGGLWTTGSSWVKPANLPVLVAAFNDAAPSQATVTVREDKRERPDYVSLTMRPGEVQVSAGEFGTAPVYLVAEGDTLYGSWDLADLRPYLRTNRLVPRVVARTLTRQHRYTADTLFEGVYRLTERATAIFTAGGLTVHYPEPAEHVLVPRSLRSDIDPVDAFDRLLTQVVRETPVAAASVGVELSGGADSGNVALSVSAAGLPRVHSFGLLMGGDLGRQQRDRRKALVDHCGFRDTAIPALPHPPFVPGGVRAAGRPHDPAGAFYQEAFDVLREQAAGRRCEVMFTGNGGDEINACHSRTHARPPETARVPWLGPQAVQALGDLDEELAPIPVLPVPTLMAFGMHNPEFVRVGIWPVSPLVDPRIVRFMEQLPYEYKRGKAMFRERLRRAGLSDEVAAPANPENFLALMEAGMRSYALPLLDDMLRESLLVDLGYVDPKALADARQEAECAPLVPDLLCDVLALEVGLRTLG
ncbi:asparagine synthase C-terminal domain-containing protein [Streptomyces sp. NPDC050095]|uniref:asparagine synthase C-terminal domain-containing protein n=1 Tax=unclassified Streptomyces TaxID=2593676 RepID=UPI00343BF2D0